MKTVSSLLDDHWYERYRKISKLNIRSSIYDVTNRCNLRCKGCFFFSSDEHKAATEQHELTCWEDFIDREMARGVNLAILIGGEPTLCLDRVEAFYKRLPTFCATNGLIKVPRDRFPDMMVGISLWGDEADEKTLRGKDTFSISSRNYEGDPHAYYLYTITPKQIGKTEHIIRKIRDVGLEGAYAAALQRRGRGRILLDERRARRYPRRDGCHAGCLSGHGDLVQILPPHHHHRPHAGPTLRLERVPLGDPAPGSPGSATQTADELHPLGIGSEDHAPLLHLGNPGLQHLQGRRRPHELGHGQQAGAYEYQ